ncbi:MAG: aldo/keto reductase [Acidimicrobiales bacterium]
MNPQQPADQTGPVVEEDGTADRAAPEPQVRAVPVVDTVGGLSVPRLGIGTWQLAGDEATASVEDALEIGYRHIDTAQMYDNEEAVGRGIASASLPREELFVTTKIANDHHEPDDLVASTERSLDRLGLDHVDLLLLHWPTAWDRIGATMASLAQVQAAGMTRGIGVSNFTLEQLETVLPMAPLDVLQAECHPFFRQDSLRSWCAGHGWAFTAYSPIARGDVFDDATLRDIAERHDASPADIAIAWLLHQENVVAIPRSADREHILQNWDAQRIRLDDDDVARIESLDEHARLVDPDVAPW